MRFAIIAAISLLALASAGGAFAQSNQPPAQKNIRDEHPEWFNPKPVPYRPCPAAVTFANGQNACLGCPAACGFHF
jgi:hypothetical protein